MSRHSRSLTWPAVAGAARPGRPRLQARISATALAAVVLIAALSGCGQPAEPEVAARFALTQADVDVPDPEAGYPVSMVLLDAADSPVWTDVASVVLSGEDGQEVDVLEYSVERGDTTDHGMLGSLLLTVAPERETTVETLTLNYSDGESTTHRIGSWHFTAGTGEGPPVLEAADGYAAVYSGVDRMTAPLTNVSDADVTVGVPALEARVDAVRIDGEPAERGDTVRLAPGEQVEFEFELAAANADFLVVTPRVPVRRDDGTEAWVALPSAQLGLLNITDEQVEAIALR
ncbi:hypothetical protein [Zhihengliuella halotolerans]|uniref:Uncharacterized protein n=1 Tax=Zhihengliuella halotolerans TaxID=370736 RepID=A0A4Q8AEH5_9MICC|nr:hypothetical protein [Zhihengliuella halotolerans]RZU62687.1 hypothetical protein EV380_2289 [Zhihengliuella halotolerans]